MRLDELFTVIDEGKNDQHIFKAIIAIGIPGSGKTTVLKNITSHTGLKLINTDELLELIQNKYNIQDVYHDENYSRYKEIYSKKVDNHIKGRLGLVIDGTNRDFTVLTKLKQ
jgi:cytidylate kinase